MAYEIEKNVPIPVGQGNMDQFPFGGMEVGDSFVVPALDVVSCRNSANRYKMLHGSKFTIRAISGVYHCWRVS